MILGKSETARQFETPRTVLLFYEVPPSRVAKQVIGPRIPRSWLDHLGDENLDVLDTDEIDSWVSKDLLKTSASVEPVSELHNCQMWMTAIVMGDVNAVFIVESAHRRHLLAARAERTIPVDQRTPPSRA